MRELILKDRTIDDTKPFIIAEIGSNHMGSVEVCKQLIKIAANCGADAVKLQKRNNEAMFTKAQLQQPYVNDNSLGPTYGEHRGKLDWFSNAEYADFIALADKLGIMFFATAFDEPSADFLASFDIPAFKIASSDVRNIPLLQYVAGFGKPMIISTGGCYLDDIKRAHDALHAVNFTDFAFLHCVATYPNQDDELNLRVIGQLMDIFKHHVIGFSTHHPGIMPLILAYTEGARIFEVHITTNRALGGTDHAFSFEPRGFERVCEDLKRINAMLGDGVKRLLDREKGGFTYKFGKAVHIVRPVEAGQPLRREDVSLKAPASGLPPWELEGVIGKIAVCDLSTADILGWEKVR